MIGTLRDLVEAQRPSRPRLNGRSAGVGLRTLEAANGRHETSSFEQVVAQAAAKLVSVRHEHPRSFVTTPLMYPSGGSVVVWIDRSPPHFFVSDYSFGARECEIMGADKRQFSKHATPIAEASGLCLSLDGGFEIFVSQGQLAGAIKAVSGASLEATISYATRLQKRRQADARRILQSKLERIFGKNSVEKEHEFKGASATSWQIDASVTRKDEIALFETVTPWFPSVASALAKFGDIRLLENPPSRTAVSKRSRKTDARRA